jgi:hypothetical protein
MLKLKKKESKSSESPSHLLVFIVFQGQEYCWILAIQLEQFRGQYERYTCTNQISYNSCYFIAIFLILIGYTTKPKGEA